MKKLLLSLGTVAAIVAPVASVVACGKTTTPTKTKTTTPTKTVLLLNGLKPSKVLTYNFSDNMTKAEFDKNCNDFTAEEQKIWTIPVPTGSTIEQKNKFEANWIATHSFPLFKIIYQGKTVSVDLTDDNHISAEQKAMGASIKALATKLGSQERMDIS